MLSITIERKRAQMLETAKTFGMSSTQTLKCSQELDRLLQLHLSNQLRDRDYHLRKIS
ncbi:aspartyl-phosphate phosphatase Spo0E family protein [Pseudalkalibacillus berkeleyi]|uniref:Aspartyl-phosphate phosphatase Spo0E family protein n=1 Tax=Pseudalkalibacillus berkeleyi TaxID=1069813 RepID=A0ABS9GZF3_9BACL|nr:aspartyl-phosphate phosphatase Spo0E family protein [Pseudalkalibacillus berkeleyi]MCF6136912.1 aspartyl-phosphate phosphatase Spo0E family protein [Pseudalkalibacillus berkeleyi]